MPSPKARLAAFVTGLSLLAVVVLVAAPVDEAALREALEPLGAAAPFGFVVLGALLGAVFVPGPIIAGASGLLFGTATGFVVSLASTICTSVMALGAARAAGREGVQELENPRVHLVERVLQRHGVGAVVFQRLLPGVPDAPCSYLFGLAGLRVWQIALGTLIGSAPRAFSYTAIGDGLGEGPGSLAVVGLVVLGVTSVVGATAAAVVVRRARRG